MSLLNKTHHDIENNRSTPQKKHREYEGTELDNFNQEEEEEETQFTNEATANRFFDTSTGYIICVAITAVIGIGIALAIVLALHSSVYVLVAVVVTSAIILVGGLLGLCFWIEWLYRTNRIVHLKLRFNRYSSISRAEITKICEDHTGHSEALIFRLIERGVDKALILVAASDTKNMGVIDYLLGRSDSSLFINKKIEGSAALHVACRRGFGNVVEKLLENGANPNLEEERVNEKAGGRRSRQLPLHIACKKRHEYIVRSLLEHGANKDLKNGKGRFAWQETRNPRIRIMLGVPIEEGSNLRESSEITIHTKNDKDDNNNLNESEQ